MKTKGSRVDGEGNKRCAKCEETKPQEMFSRNRTAPDGREHYCKECKKKQVGKWKEENPDYHKHWYAEKGRESSRKYYHKNKDRLSTGYPPEKQSAYRRNPEFRAKRNEYQRKRNAEKLIRTPSWLTKDHKRKIRNFEAAAKNMTKATGVLHHVDHIAPSLGANISGLHVPWNLQVITATDNSKKGMVYAADDAWPEEIQIQMRHDRWDAERYGE